MSSQTLPECCVILADIVGSKTANDNRSAFQSHLKSLAASLNIIAGSDVLSPFQTREGDALRGVLSSARHVVELLWSFDAQAISVPLSVGIGWGRLTFFTSFPDDVDGPAFHNARQAVTLASDDSKLGPRFSGFDNDSARCENVIQAIASLLSTQRNEWTAKQREVAVLLRRGESQVAIAKALHVTPQNINNHIKNMQWQPYQFAEAQLQKTLEAFDCSAAWQQLIRNDASWHS